MTSKLEEQFNIPSMKALIEKAKAGNTPSKEIADTTKEISKELKRAIISESEIIEHDANMELYAKDAYDHAVDIMDLGKNVEPRHSADMFRAAAEMIKIAIEANNSKLEKKLRLMELQIKDRRVKIDEMRTGTIIQGDLIERDDILKEDF